MTDMPLDANEMPQEAPTDSMEGLSSRKHYQNDYLWLSEDETRRLKSMLRTVIDNRDNAISQKIFSQRSGVPEPTINKMVRSETYSKRMRHDIAEKIAVGLGHGSLEAALAWKEGGRGSAKAVAAIEEEACSINIRLLPPKEVGDARGYALEIADHGSPVAFFTFKSQRIDAQDHLMRLVNRIVDRRAGPMVAGIMLRRGLEEMRLKEGGVAIGD